MGASPFWLTYVIGTLYFLNACWLAYHGHWSFAGYWLSALAITYFSYRLASGQ